MSCKICLLKFKNDNNLSKHIKIVHGDLNTSIDICHSDLKIRSTDINVLEKESTDINKNQRIRPSLDSNKKEMKSTGLYKAFKKQTTDIYKHQFIRDTAEEDMIPVNQEIESGQQYICDLCIKAIGSAFELKNHFRTIHKSDYPFICIVCNDRFSEEKSFIHHCSSVHYNSPMNENKTLMIK